MTQPFPLLKSSHDCSTFVEILRFRSSTQPEQIAFTFLEDGETTETTLTYRELERRSMALASRLQALGLSGERALLLYPPGLDYLVAFFGCLYARVVAVPAYPPRNQRNTPRIKAVVKDAQAAIALTTSALLPTVRSLLAVKADADIEKLQWLATDNLEPGIENTWQESIIHTDTLAFLQYTSGSTGTPKGVMLSHGNLFHNAAMTYKFMEHTPESKFVSWLPVYHDMGLIGGILQPLYGGFPCILMSPAAFLQRPYRWLQAISKYKGTTSGGPNFAYEQCIQKITPEQRQTLDLSSWSVAFNGAEPVRHETLEQFAATFAECGFRKEAFYPCYGMAEATLMVSGGNKSAIPTTKKVTAAALANNRIDEVSAQCQDVKSLVSCGFCIPEQQIVIANPETLNSCQAEQVGEIWVAGASVGQGYWNRLEETQNTFQAYLKDTGAGPFLRTGDLGFLHNGELYVTGRVKDLIIIRGRNLYPQDIELTVERSHSALRIGSSAAFSVEVDNEERLFVVQELEFRAKPDIKEVIAEIRQAVAQEHEVQAYGVVLIKPGTIPKTSSGKIQRRLTRAKLLSDELDVVGSNTFKDNHVVNTATELRRDTLLHLTPQERQPLLESYLQAQVARVVGILPEAVIPAQPLTTWGLDSLAVFELKNRIEVDLEVDIAIAEFFAGLSLRSLSHKILAEFAQSSHILAPLTPAPQTKTYPLAGSQQGLWFISQLTPENPSYNVPIEINFQGDLNIAALEASLNEIIKRHAILRTNFVMVEDEVVQVIQPSASLSLEVEDRQEFSAQVTVQQPFTLTSGLLLRAKLLRLAAKEYKLLLTLHHIIVDGWSVGILIRELAAIYEAFAQGKPSPLPDLSLQYVDFAVWQKQLLQSTRIQSSLTYWQQQLSGKLPILNLPTDRPRSSISSYKGAQATLALSPTLSAELKKLSQQEGATLYMTLLAAFKTLLYRYTGQTDILVGSPIASRNRIEIKPLIGFFVNVLVLRSNLANTPSFRELLAQVKSTTLTAYAHQDIPFQKLVETLQPERDLSYHPLFQVAFVLQNIPISTPQLTDLSIAFQERFNGAAKFDLTLYMEDTESGLVATLEYNTDLFNPDTTQRMLENFSTLLTGIVTNPKQSIASLPLLTASETKQLLVDWNNTQTDYSYKQCIHQLFEQQVEKTPDAIAVVFENQQLTYRELNQRANQLAHYLQQLSVQPDTLVGICIERSLEMVIGLLGILKAGGAYVPLDPSYPQQRLTYMLTDTQVSILLTQQRLVSTLPATTATVICLDTDWTKIVPQSQDNPHSQVQSQNLAYVIYTSGSTGQPKGVMNTHQGLCNRLLWMQDELQLTASDRVLQKTPFSFDVSVWEFFWPLITGARLVIAQPEGHKDSAYLVKLIVTEGITTLHFVPSMLQIFLTEPDITECKSIKRVVCSGEALTADLQAQFFAYSDAELYNLYGPTEAAIDVSCWRCDRTFQTRLVPIGRPIANTQLYILDQYLQPVPIGVPGELHIGGVGLATGYLNRPELTAEKFIPNPFICEQGTEEVEDKKRDKGDKVDKEEENSILHTPKLFTSHQSTVNSQQSPVNSQQSPKLYKTGDLARFLPDGNIEYLGRIDHQVKIRGFRIELEEIDAILNQHPDVQVAISIVQDAQAGDKRLVSYVVPNNTSELKAELYKSTPIIDDVRQFVKTRLPEYMVPSAFILLDSLPLSPNGKIDRKALPAVDNVRPQLPEIAVEPRSDLEKTIAKVWQEVLHLEKVGINQNFFDLGGHSLLMAQVNNKLRAILQQDLSIVVMFEHPTIAALAQYLSQKSNGSSTLKSVRDRANKQIEAIKRKKQLLNKQTKNIYE